MVKIDGYFSPEQFFTRNRDCLFSQLRADSEVLSQLIHRKLSQWFLRYQPMKCSIQTGSHRPKCHCSDLIFSHVGELLGWVLFNQLQSAIDDLSQKNIVFVHLTNFFWNIDALNHWRCGHDFTTKGILARFKQVVEPEMWVRVLVDTHVGFETKESGHARSVNFLLHYSVQFE